MRCMDLKGHTHKFSGCQYKYYFESFCTKFMYPMSINTKMIIPKKAHANLVTNTHLPSVSLPVKSIEEEIQSFSNQVISTKARYWNKFKNSFNKPC